MTIRKLVVLLAMALAATAFVASATSSQCVPPDGGGCITTY